MGDATVLDMSILQVNDDTFLRFFVNGTAQETVAQVSTSGLFGPWEWLYGHIESPQEVEGPYDFWDNIENGKAYLLCDTLASGSGNLAWVSSNPTSEMFERDVDHNLKFMRHLSVLSVTQQGYDALAAL